MGIFDRFRRARSREEAPRAQGDLIYTGDLNDPKIAEFLRTGGSVTASGASVNADSAMRVTAVMRCVHIIAGTVGMLPLHLFRQLADGDAQKATEHPLYRLLYRKPNRWQTALEFRSMLQAHAVLRGNGYAYKVKGGRGQLLELLPLDPDRMQVEQRDDLSLVYKYSRRDGGRVEFAQDEVLHLRDLSTDGVLGLSRIAQAREAIGLAMQAEKAGGRFFGQGNMLGGAIGTKESLSEKARENIRASLEEKFSGAENAGKWLVLEEGLEPKSLGPTAADLQFIDTRKFQAEDIARIFGVPPHMIGAVDKTTSWGQGIENQSIGFVVFTMQPWFTAWEQTILRDCLNEAEAETLYPKFNVTALLRGSAKDRAEYFKAALGAGGSRPWMTQNEVRGAEELNRIDDPDADRLLPPANSQVQAAADSPVPADQGQTP